MESDGCSGRSRATGDPAQPYPPSRAEVRLPLRGRPSRDRYVLRVALFAKRLFGLRGGGKVERAEHDADRLGSYQAGQPPRQPHLSRPLPGTKQRKRAANTRRRRRAVDSRYRCRIQTPTQDVTAYWVTLNDLLAPPVPPISQPNCTVETTGLVLPV